MSNTILVADAGLHRPASASDTIVDGVGNIVGGTGAPATVFRCSAGSLLAAYRAVRLADSGKLEYASSATEAYSRSIGIILATTSADAVAEVMGFGEITNVAWTWTAGDRIFLGENGAIQAAPPSSGVVKLLGYATTATKIFVQIAPGIKL